MMNVRTYVGFLLAILFMVLSLCGCSLIDSARIYEKKGDYNIAVQYYEKAVSMKLRDVKKAFVYMRLVQVYARAGQFGIAEMWFERLLQIISNLPEESTRKILTKTDIKYYRALVALREGNYKRSIDLLESMKDVTLKELASDIHYYLSIAYGSWAKDCSLEGSIPAVKALDTPSQEFRSAIDLINQGRELVKSGQPTFDEAKGKFESAISSVPESSPTQNNYEKALLLIKKKEYAGAISILSQMGETADVSYYLGKACREQAFIHAQKATQWLEEEKKKETQKDVIQLYENALESLNVP